MNVHEQWTELVRVALYGAGKKEIKLGNLEVGIDYETDNIWYSLPTEKWNAQVSVDLSDAVIVGRNRFLKIMKQGT